jgi:hypothetical protein
MKRSLFRIGLEGLLLALFFSCAPGLHAQQNENWLARHQRNVSATQSMQPHWVTPVATVTPRLEQEIRSDFVHQYNSAGFSQWNLGNGKGLEMIPERHTELLFNLPPFISHTDGTQDGFGDISFLMKERLFARNEEHGNSILTVFLGASVPTGKNGNGKCCAIVTPTLAGGKGWGLLALTSTLGGTLPVTNAQGLGHSILWNNVVQYRLSRTGMARFFWPEIELNSTFYKGGSNNGRKSTYATPGLVVGRIPFTHGADGKPGRLGLTIGFGEQIAVTSFHTYNHAAIITARMPF